MSEKNWKENLTEEEKQAEQQADEEAKEQANQESGNSFDKYIFRVKNPVNFEGAEIKEIDLHNFQNATTADLMRATDIARLKNIPVDGVNYEYSPAFLYLLVSVICGVPNQMIEQLSLQDGYLLRRRILYFLIY